jgi:hypothetical protein
MAHNVYSSHDQTGVIRGSEGTLTLPERSLSREAYDALSHRSQSTFADQRSRIYSIFESYMKRKRERGDYDATDRLASQYIVWIVFVDLRPCKDTRHPRSVSKPWCTWRKS